MSTIRFTITEGPLAHTLAAERLAKDVEDVIRFHGDSAKVSYYWDDAYLPEIEDSIVEYGVKVELAGQRTRDELEMIAGSIKAHCGSERFSRVEIR